MKLNRIVNLLRTCAPSGFFVSLLPPALTIFVRVKMTPVCRTLGPFMFVSDEYMRDDGVLAYGHTKVGQWWIAAALSYLPLSLVGFGREGLVLGLVMHHLLYDLVMWYRVFTEVSAYSIQLTGIKNMARRRKTAVKLSHLLCNNHRLSTRIDEATLRELWEDYGVLDGEKKDDQD